MKTREIILVETCGRCHPGTGENFAFGTIHVTDAVHGNLGAVVRRWVHRVAGVIMLGGGLWHINKMNFRFTARGKHLT